MIPVLTDVVQPNVKIISKGGSMLLSDDLGYDIEKIPVSQVRVICHRNKWYVEYRKAVDKDAGWFKHLWNHLIACWWFDDSLHSNYSDAAVRANVLTATGYFEKLVKKQKFILNVKK